MFLLKIIEFKNKVNMKSAVTKFPVFEEIKKRWSPRADDLPEPLKVREIAARSRKSIAEIVLPE